jgi:DnaK suppressor protein
MARKDALLRMHNRLVAKRDALRSKLIDELNLGSGASLTGPGDIGDEAYEGSRAELDSRLASHESRELAMVERALLAMREGRYGKCEGCIKAIPIARLQALPFATFCVTCQRDAELSDHFDPDGDADWEAAFLYEGRSSDRELTLQDIDLD